MSLLKRRQKNKVPRGPRPLLYLEKLEDRTAPAILFNGAGGGDNDNSPSPTLGAATDGGKLQVVAPPALSALQWTNIGPAPIVNGQIPDRGPVSGRITALAADPSNASVIYIATAGGGVWKTTDAGVSWTPLTDNQPLLFMGAIAVAASNSQVIYAGTGEADNSADSFYGDGILKSADGGQTWALEGSTQFNRRAISQIAVDPTDANTVYAAVTDFPFVSNGLEGNTGIWKSTDGGTTWTNTTTSISALEPFTDVAIDPSNSQILFAAVGDVVGNLFGPDVNGLYKSTNGGASWTAAGNFPMGGQDGLIKIAIAQTNPAGAHTIYAAISEVFGANGSPLLAIEKSTDDGVTWAPLVNVPDYMGPLGQGWYDSTIAVDPHNANIVYAGGAGSDDATGSIIVRTADGGATWTDISNTPGPAAGPHADNHGIGFDANGKLMVGTDGGIWRLDDPSTITWTDLNSNIDTIQFTGIALDPTNPSIAIGGSQDNGTEKFTGNIGWTLSQFGDGGFVQIDQSNPNIIYHTFPYSPGEDGFLERSDDGGLTWTGKTSGINTNNDGNFYVPYVMDPSNSSRLVLGTDHVYETTNRADTWHAIGGPGFSGWTTTNNIDAIAISRSNPNTVYVTAGGVVLVTFNDGSTWREIDVPGFNDQFGKLAVDPTNDQVAYIVRNAFTAGTGGHVFKTVNGGVTWTDISGNLPNIPSNSIVLDPRNGTIFIGTDAGVYASLDGGSTWSRFGNGMANAQVVDMVLNTTTDILAVGTHGRGMWEILVPITPVLSGFQIVGPATTAAGASFTFTVEAVDQFDNVFTNYSGTVHFTSSDAAATGFLPADSTLIDGMGTFTATLVTAGNQTITATDTVDSTVTGTSDPIDVSPGVATHFEVSAPAGATAGNAFTFTVTALDQFNNRATGYTGTVHFTSSDGSANLPADAPLTSGTGTFSATLNAVGNQTITATDTSDATITGTSASILVALPATHFLVTAELSSVTAGTMFTFTVTALDATESIAAGYSGTVHFTSTDGAATLPANATLTGGTGTFNVILRTAGSQTITATDTVNSSLTGTSDTITVDPGVATKFGIGAPATATAGASFSFTVTALDQFSNVATGYSGTVHFTSSDGSAILPGDAGLINGIGTFSATLKTAGKIGVGQPGPQNQTIVVTDTANASIKGTGTVLVHAAAATHFDVGGPLGAIAGTSFSISVSAADPFDNFATSYTGTVKLTSTDPAPVLPPPGPLSGGSFGSITVTLNTAGLQTITATDTVDSTITGSTLPIGVSAGAATHFVFSVPATTTAGTSFTFTVTALDAGGNQAFNYFGQVHFTSSDVRATLPNNTNLTNGVGTFSATLKTAGNQTITATDASTSSITGTSTAIAVSPGAATGFILNAPASTTAGSLISITVTAQDAFNNVATGYTGTVHFSSTDGQATLPANGGLTNGVGHFSAILRTAGTQTITATDTVNSSLTAHADIAVSPGSTAVFKVTGPASSVAGNAFNITVAALDAFNNPTPAFRDNVFFSSSDFGATLPPEYQFTVDDQGVHTFKNLSLTHTGTQTIIVFDLSNPSFQGSVNIAVSPGSRVHFQMQAPATARAGVAFTVVLTSFDQFNNLDTNYLGQVHFSSSGAVDLPADYQFVGSDHGSHAFVNGVTMGVLGAQGVLVADTNVAQSLANAAATIQVTPGPATHFRIVMPANVTLNVPFTISVNAVDAFENLATDYVGTVHFTTTDPKGVVPVDVTFTAANAGAVTLGNQTIFRTPGPQTLFASGTVALASGPVVGVSSTTPWPDTSETIGQTGTVSLDSEVEPTIAVDPNNSLHLVGVWQQDRWSDGGSRGIVAGVSLDGGSTWTNVPIPGVSRVTGGPLPRASDPWVSFAPNGTVYLSVLSAESVNGSRETINISKSVDGGFTWGAPIALIADTDPHFFDDKEAVTADPTNSNLVYATWDRLAFDSSFNFINGPAWFSRSTNGGQTWETARIIYNAPANTQTVGNQIVVLPNGTLLDVFDFFGNTTDFEVIRSTDHGLTWSAPTVVAADLGLGITDPNTHAEVRAGTDLPGVAVDRSSGTVYVVWEDGRFSGSSHEDIAISQSVDGGLTWSTPIKVNQTPTNIPTADQQAFTPQVAVAANGEIGVSYYDFRHNTGGPGLLTDYWIAFSSPGASLSFGNEQRLTATSFNGELAPESDVASGLANMIGDYEGLVAGGPSFNAFASFFEIAQSSTNPSDIVFRLAVPPSASGSVGTIVGSNVANTLANNTPVLMATGADFGHTPEVKVFNPATGAVKFDFMAYDPHFLGGVRVAMGDVNGDGIPDIITAPGLTGGPDIRVFDGVTGKKIKDFMAYNARFTGGVFVAVGDLNNDGFADIITGADAGGGPEVRVFSGATGLVLRDFYAYSPFFNGGVRVAAGDVNHDGYVDIITGAGPGGSPHVEVFSGKDNAILRSFMAYSAFFTGGVFVSAGDINGDGYADIITGAGAGGGPHVKVLSGLDGSLLGSFMAYSTSFSGGVRVAAIDINRDGHAFILTAPGSGPTLKARVINSSTLTDLDSFFAYESDWTGGLFVGGQ
jgi:hypothetical protein